MKRRTTILISGLVLLVLAGSSWLIETTQYGGIDANGVLQESFFLPLTFILGALGLVFLAAAALVRR